MKNRENMEIFWMTVDHREAENEEILEGMKEAYIIATERLDVLASIASEMKNGKSEIDPALETLIYDGKTIIASCLSRCFRLGMTNETIRTNKKLSELLDNIKAASNQ